MSNGCPVGSRTTTVYIKTLLVHGRGSRRLDGYDERTPNPYHWFAHDAWFHERVPELQQYQDAAPEYMALSTERFARLIAFLGDHPDASSERAVFNDSRIADHAGGPLVGTTRSRITYDDIRTSGNSYDTIYDTQSELATHLHANPN